MIKPSDQAKEIAHEMVKVMETSSEEYRKPKCTTHMAIEIQEMIDKDQRDPQRIFSVFHWALNDHFWKDKFFKPNPAKYLRDKFEQLYAKMTAPKPKEKRRFAPSSNDAEALETFRRAQMRAV